MRVNAKSDLVENKLSFLLIWGAPSLLIALTYFIKLHNIIHTAIWFLSLLLMGFGCLINAKNCNRYHCYYTGPYFLVLAAISIMHGFAIFSLGEYGWHYLGISLLSGFIFLYLFLERFTGKYRKIS